MKTKALISHIVGGVLVLQNAAALSQTCQHANGLWTVTTTFEEGALDIAQFPSGALSGAGYPNYCASPWPLVGAFNDENANLAATIYNPVEPFDYVFGCAQWVIIEAEVQQPGCDTAEGTFENSFNGSGNVTLQKQCDIPTNETASFIGWDDAGGYPTLGKWKQQLSHAWSLGGRTVVEQDPGGTGNDTCWFSGSAFQPAEAITGGSWPVQTDSTWEADYIGWVPDAVTYYRAVGRAPCGTSFQQDMEIDCSGGDVYYGFWTLAMNITATQVTSQKGSSQQTRTWP